MTREPPQRRHRCNVGGVDALQLENEPAEEELTSRTPESDEETIGVSRGRGTVEREAVEEDDEVVEVGAHCRATRPLARRTAYRAAAPMSRSVSSVRFPRRGWCLAMRHKCQDVAALSRLSTVGRRPSLCSSGGAAELRVAA